MCKICMKKSKKNLIFEWDVENVGMYEVGGSLFLAHKECIRKQNQN